MAGSTIAARRSLVDGRLVANTPICREHVRIEVVCRDFPRSEPGQFVQLRCGDDRPVSAHEVDWPKDGFPSLLGDEWRGPRAFLRRPFSIADQWTDLNGQAHLALIARAVGPGTRWLEQLRPGDTLSVMGPLGRGFTLPARGTPIVLLGGGVGIPPLLFLARRLYESRWSEVTAIFGATTGALLPVVLRGDPPADGTPCACVALPGGATFPALVTTEDGSVGLRGLVTDGLSLWQRRRPASARRGLVCACGPETMLQATARLTRQLALDCQLCIERNMGCGLGTCLSCVVRRRAADEPNGWRWALACVDGPVFQRDELLDYDA